MNRLDWVAMALYDHMRGATLNWHATSEKERDAFRNLAHIALEAGREFDKSIPYSRTLA